MNRVVIIGSGNLAEALARALAAARGLQLVQIHARNEERGREVAILQDAPGAAIRRLSPRRTST